MALVGDDVTLSYDTKRLTDISEETVEWSRADLNPDLVHLHEDHRTFYEEHNPAYRGRTVLSEEDLERGIISLRLSRVRLADEGNYTCLFSSVHNQYTVQLLVGEAHSVMALVGDDVTLSYDTKRLTDISEETVEWSRADLNPDLVHLHEDHRTFYEEHNPAYKGERCCQKKTWREELSPSDCPASDWPMKATTPACSPPSTTSTLSNYL
ncbi:hypothetical protein NHX12_014003 [Muraenolepis orangiensis]|uniref:Ig-like domain-containing protein n=1 Tax=Muraenolepis orangiensis TaxID=630683 RepID=A0A9Q0I3C0_9TELE|nr:hypothetical protein NHX12_014003 [Muraenolepis orangiensis]